MTQQVVHARVSIPSLSSLGDTYDYGFTFEATGSDTDLTMANLDEFIEYLFNNPVGPTGSTMTQSLAAWMSVNASRATNAVEIQYTDITAHLDGSAAGPAFQITNFTLAAEGGASGIPDHDSVCVGYRAPYGTDIERGVSAAIKSSESAVDQGAPATHTGITKPRARDRGRIYLGPWDTAANAAGVPAPTLLSDLGIWANELIGTKNPGAPNQFNFVQWSRAAARVQSCSFYYVDEGFATQRRRGDTTLNRVHTWVSGTNPGDI